MQIDDKLIAYLEDLSQLKLLEDEKSKITKDLQDILKYMSQLSALDTEGIAERSHPFDHVNNFREDKVGPGFDRKLILQNAPVHNEETFIAPKTVE